MATINDLFGDSSEDDDFVPSKRQSAEGSEAQEGDMEVPSGPAAEAAGTSTVAAGTSAVAADDDDDFQDRPAPRQPQQLREYSDDDEGYVQEEVQERPVGPPLNMSGALLPLPGINNLRLLQTSKFLAVQSLPMTPGNLRKERDDPYMDDMGEVKYRYKNQMTIRWRKRTLPSGETVLESNARFVKWSNGTTQLLLGDEVLDIAELDNTSANQFLFVRHSQPVPFIQGQGQLIKKLHLRPASLSSKFHKQLTADAARKHERVNKVKATATVADPNRAKAEREKAEEARIRANETLQRRQDREQKKYPAMSRREYRPAGITPQFLETIEDEPDYSDDEDLTATERARSAMQRSRVATEDEEREAERRLARAKHGNDEWDTPSAIKRQREEDEQGEGDLRSLIVEDDDEDDFGARLPAKKGRRGLVVSDDEDD